MTDRIQAQWRSQMCDRLRSAIEAQDEAALADLLTDLGAADIPRKLKSLRLIRDPDGRIEFLTAVINKTDAPAVRMSRALGSAAGWLIGRAILIGVIVLIVRWLR